MRKGRRTARVAVRRRTSAAVQCPSVGSAVVGTAPLAWIRAAEAGVVALAPPPFAVESSRPLVLPQRRAITIRKYRRGFIFQISNGEVK